MDFKIIEERHRKKVHKIIRPSDYQQAAEAISRIQRKVLKRLQQPSKQQRTMKKKNNLHKIIKKGRKEKGTK